ncbi:MAG: hypothetical protein MK025_04390 [Acidobacteriia bacterium]|nr:hypothetical protein [Terriglobia bacterium]
MLRRINELGIAKSFIIGDRYSDFKWYMNLELSQFLYCPAIVMKNIKIFETIEK